MHQHPHLVHGIGGEPALGFPGPRQVVTVHDVEMWRESQPGPALRLYGAMLASAIRRCAAVIAVSRTTRDEAIETLRLDPARVHVVPHGVAPAFSGRPKLRDARVADALGLEAEFVLWVGSLRAHDSRKGLDTLLAAMERLGESAPPLALVGALGPEADRLAADAWRRHVEIVLCGSIDDADLASLYRRASVVALPSTHEGFGLTALEAMASAAPVVADGSGEPSGSHRRRGPARATRRSGGVCRRDRDRAPRPGPERAHAPRRHRSSRRVLVGSHRRADRRRLPGGGARGRLGSPQPLGATGRAQRSSAIARRWSSSSATATAQAAWSVPATSADPLRIASQLIGVEAEAQVLRKRTLPRREHRIRNSVHPGARHLEEHGPLDAVEPHRDRVEISRVRDLEEERRGQLAGSGHHRVERDNLARDALRVVDALAAQRLLECRTDGVAILEDQGQGIAEVDPPEALELGHPPALVAPHRLVCVPDPYLIEADRVRSLERHEHLRALQTWPHRTATDSGTSARTGDASIPDLSGMLSAR